MSLSDLEPSLATVFRMFDTNHNQLLSFKEAKNCVHSDMVPKGRGLEKDVNPMPGTIDDITFGEVFAQIDQDQSGELSYSELMNLL